MNKLILVPLVIVLAFTFVFAGCTEDEVETPTPPTETAKPAETPAATAEPATPAETPATPTESAAPVEPAEPEPGGPQSGGVLRIIQTEGPSGSIGIPGNMFASMYWSQAMLETLLTANSEGDILPSLATDWEWTNDYKTITFTLRKGVKFHDGTDFNADIVKWNWDQAVAKGVGGSQFVESTEVIDDYTFRVNLTEYQSTWFVSLAKMETNLGWIISPPAVETHGEEYIDWHPVGTGPFKFKDYVRDNYLEVERFDGYWGEKSYLDGIKFIFIADPVTAQMSFEAGEGDALFAQGQMEKIMHDLVPEGYIAETFPGLTLCLIPSSGNPDSPFANRKVREAVEYAIDKAKICESVYRGYGEPLYECAFPWHPEFIPGLEGRQYNPDKAKQLLVDAGYPDGFTTTFYAGVHLSGDHVVAIQAYLQAVNIIADIDPISVGKWIELETNGWEEGILLTPQGGQSPFGTYMMRFWWTPDAPNWSQGLYWTAMYRPDALQDLALQYLKSPTAEEQKEVGQGMVQLMYDDCMAIPLWQGASAYIIQPYVQGTRWSDTSCPTPWNYSSIWLSE